MARTSSKPGPRGAAARTTDPADSLAESTTLLARTASLLEQLVAAVESAIAKGEGNSALVRESAGLVRAAASLSAEQRALAKAAEQAEMRQAENVLEHLTVVLAVQFINGLPDKERWRAIHQLKGQQSSRSGGVLG